MIYFVTNFQEFGFYHICSCSRDLFVLGFKSPICSVFNGIVLFVFFFVKKTFLLSYMWSTMQII